jgi:hypothetical protein
MRKILADLKSNRGSTTRARNALEKHGYERADRLEQDSKVLNSSVRSKEERQNYSDELKTLSELSRAQVNRVLANGTAMKIAEFSRSQLRYRHNERCPFKAPLMMDNDKSDENGPTFPEQGRRADLFLKEGKLVRGVLEKGAMQILKNPEELPALHRPSIHPETPPRMWLLCGLYRTREGVR